MQQRGTGKNPAPPHFSARHLSGCGELAHSLGAAHQQIGRVVEVKHFGVHGFNPCCIGLVIATRFSSLMGMVWLSISHRPWRGLSSVMIGRPNLLADLRMSFLP